MIYNEYAQVLETTNPETGNLYKPGRPEHHQLERLPRRDAPGRDLRPQGVARPGRNKDIAVRFIRASLKGWIYCRDHPDDCVQYTTDAGSQLGTGHQKWMMNEINALVWPSPIGVGMMDPVFWGQTVKVAKNAGVIKNVPGIDAYTTDYVKQALAGITDDTKGASFQKGTVQVTPGGN